MTQRRTREAQPSLIEDLLNAQHDLIALGERHGMDAAALSAWADDPSNTSCLRGLCALADMQTQLLLSRYRLHAAGRLVQMATEEDGGDASRRACVDLLKLDFRAPEDDRPAQPTETDDDAADIAALREALFGGNGGETEGGAA